MKKPDWNKMAGSEGEFDIRQIQGMIEGMLVDLYGGEGDGKKELYDSLKASLNENMVVKLDGDALKKEIVEKPPSGLYLLLFENDIYKIDVLDSKTLFHHCSKHNEGVDDELVKQLFETLQKSINVLLNMVQCSLNEVPGLTILKISNEADLL